MRVGLVMDRRSFFGSLGAAVCGSLIFTFGHPFRGGQSNRINHEEWFEISNPLLKVIRFIGEPDWQKDRLMPRYFTRFGQRWVEV